MSVPENLHPTHNKKTLGTMKAVRAVKRITFNCTEASPSKTLYVSVPNLNENEVLVPGLLVLCFDINLSGGHANNFLVQNVTRALVDKLVVTFASSTLQDTVGYDKSKTFEDLSLSHKRRDNMMFGEYRVKTYATSTLAQGTRKPQASLLKTN